MCFALLASPVLSACGSKGTALYSRLLGSSECLYICPLSTYLVPCKHFSKAKPKASFFPESMVLIYLQALPKHKGLCSYPVHSPSLKSPAVSSNSAGTLLPPRKSCLMCPKFQDPPNG